MWSPHENDPMVASTLHEASHFKTLDGGSPSKSSLDLDPDDAESMSSSSVPTTGTKPGEDLCAICGDRASGYHYNALSCEGCKGFFRRSIMRNAFYECKFGSNCKMDMWMRRKCQACRLKQCRDVGMKEECLLSERQCIARNARRKKKIKGEVATTSSAEKSTVVRKSLPTPPPPLAVSDDSTLGSQPCQTTILDRLTEDQSELIKRLVLFQDKYELPPKEEMNKLSEVNVSETTSPDALSDAIFMHMVEMTILVTRCVVEFAKRLPGFQNISKDDQIVLLKGSASEVMMLRTARRFDPETNTVVFGTGTPFTQNSMAFGGLQDYVDTMFEFSRGMSQLYVDNAQYALLTAICTFSERPGLANLQMVAKIQDVYTEVLMAYMNVKHPVASGIHLAKLLMKLVTLRSLSCEHSQALSNLQLTKGPLPPLLSEYFDISE